MSGDPGLPSSSSRASAAASTSARPAGDEHDWGEVLAWEPPRRLAYLWHLRFDRADATEVEITFAADGEGTHGGDHRASRLGAPRRAGPERRERNARGWGGLLPHFEAACAQAA